MLVDAGSRPIAPTFATTSGNTGNGSPTVARWLSFACRPLSYEGEFQMNLATRPSTTRAALSARAACDPPSLTSCSLPLVPISLLVHPSLTHQHLVTSILDNKWYMAYGEWQDRDLLPRQLSVPHPRPPPPSCPPVHLVSTLVGVRRREGSGDTSWQRQHTCACGRC